MDENERVILAQARRQPTTVRVFGPYKLAEAEKIRDALESGAWGGVYIFTVRHVFEPERTDDVLLSAVAPRSPYDAPRAPRKLGDVMSDYHIPDL